MSDFSSMFAKTFTRNSITGLGAAGVITSALGAYDAASLEQTGYQYAGVVAGNNARLADAQAADAIRRGHTESQGVRRKYAQLKGTQSAALAAGNVDLGYGSALNILTETDIAADVDAATVKDNAAREAWLFESQAQGYRDEQRFNRWRARASSPALAGATALIGGMGSVASNWYALGKAGV